MMNGYTIEKVGNSISYEITHNGVTAKGSGYLTMQAAYEACQKTYAAIKAGKEMDFGPTP